MTRLTICVLFLVLSALVAAPAVAAPLPGNPNAYLGTWSGSTPYTSGGTLFGYVEWAVFGPGDFPYTMGYTPTPGELTYAYQLFETGSAPVSSLVVAIDNQPADNIGWFTDLGGDIPTSATFSFFPGPNPDSAEWDFAGILSGGMSAGLVFSSPNVPMDFFGSTVDDGEGAFILPLPSPSPVSVPEPSSLVLAVFGVCGLLGFTFRRRSRSL